ncbi:Very short patch repair endonuclease OS=Streptomyces aurantiogriseus OX=66870 GN=GCM10010251_22540 PE=3 SV=1 [Streptomyces aurantiogriseus]|uniref:Very short patch repair endonuclease n=2 Tax=Streptomyces aurantiogriseus TaxID=66870 RepID=A0A918C4G2_9ACTN|nr:very short patch repair endonuclease [Streptomyces aurantiogriseus]
MVDRKNTGRDGWIPTEKGEHLRGRRVRDTAPEIALRRALHGMGYRFRLHRRVAPRCTADVVLPRYGVAVFVDGCFWHGCPDHSPEEFRGPNASLWQQKIETNRERDRRNTAAATAAGWTVVRVWECEVRRDVDSAARRVAKATEHDRGRPLQSPGHTSTASARRSSDSRRGQ